MTLILNIATILCIYCINIDLSVLHDQKMN